MRLLRKPMVNAAVTTMISAFYIMVFFVTSSHMELESILEHEMTLDSDFWNLWCSFLRQGYQRYVGYLYLLLTAGIVILTAMKRRDYDEYQCRILEKGLTAAGAAAAVLFPVAMLLILSDPNYCVEAVMFLAVAHWLACLIADLIYVIKWSRD